MFMAKQYRAKAAESVKSLKQTAVPSEISKFQQSIQRFNALADNEEWLADDFEKMIQSQDTPSQNDAGKPDASRIVAQTEQRILRCLGAAVIMNWNTIPTKLQRELFDTAGSMGDLLKSVGLRGQIARFLHNQKDQQRPADHLSNRDRTSS
ncbi:MAG TPA: hypothetical protein VL198_16315 [Pseudolabrys sp.]|jgi:hypothetical protein|nr:hypothetical protein [Pseudolabrys sp.]